MRPGLAASLLLCSLGLFGCAKPPTDPLDWPVKAKSPAELEDWLEAMRKTMPPRMEYEVESALKAISANLPYYKGYDPHRYEASDDPLCLAVNHRSVRQLIQDGYDAATDSLRLEINRDLENGVRNLEVQNQTEVAPARQQAISNWNLKFEGTQIERDEAMLGLYKARIAVLDPSAP